MKRSLRVAFQVASQSPLRNLRAIRPDFLTVLLTFNKSLRTKNMKEGFKNQIRFLEIKIPFEIINVSRNQKVEFESIEQRN
ncbi:hypothetical protein [Leptospira interrogans]|uniref:hypothetical protein n=1 Tax=Leptospira interrogans TaxID=173 RepID=UPI0012B51ABE|nr:hypothetical protein [Leptospira interrogans]